MEFGPEIKVDGVRPEWLKDYNGPVKWWNCDQHRGIVCEKSATLNWGDYPGYTYGGITSFALPADHPHYQQKTHTYTVRPEDEAALFASDPLSRPTPDERAVAPELVERMRKLVEGMARGVAGNDYAEARAIVAALEPVDEDLVEARRIACDNVPSWDENDEIECVSGKYDNNLFIVIAKVALARGRQLQRDSVTGVTLGTREQFEKDCG